MSNEPIQANNLIKNKIVYELLDMEVEQLQRSYQQLFYQPPNQSDEIFSVNQNNSQFCVLGYLVPFKLDRAGLEEVLCCNLKNKYLVEC